MELGALGELVGAVAVVVTLIYLTTQLRQNTRAVRAASLQALDKRVTDNIALFAASPENAALMERGRLAHETLSEDEQAHFFLMISAFFCSMDSFFWSHRSKVLPQELWAREQEILKVWANTPGGRIAWQGAFVSKPFREYVEAHLLEPALPMPLAPPPRQNSNLLAEDR